MPLAISRETYIAQTPDGTILHNDSIPLNRIDDGPDVLGAPVHDNATSHVHDRTVWWQLTSKGKDLYKNNVG